MDGLTDLRISERPSQERVPANVYPSVALGRPQILWNGPPYRRRRRAPSAAPSRVAVARMDGARHCHHTLWQSCGRLGRCRRSIGLRGRGHA
jgi:hypothetical protein